ncbi:MAG: pseudouridine synthase [Vampirovibrionales bacterium]|nr:pseudouridine synthase [Vampirovibrionales bacterium]
MPESESSSSLRLNKFLADAGLCSRRQADVLIQSGRVFVNGFQNLEFSTRITPGVDVVTVDDRLVSVLSGHQKRYIAFHKPVGCLTTRVDKRGRTTIYDVLPADCRALDPAGRLDQDSSGLLFLSNDGDWVNRISHPRYHVAKRYKITIARAPASLAEFRQALEAGIWFEAEQKLARAYHIECTPEDNPRVFSLTLHTGYKRQIRRMFKSLGHPVVSLCRMAIGSVELADLPLGMTRSLTEEELMSFICDDMPSSNGF